MPIRNPQKSGNGENGNGQSDKDMEEPFHYIMRRTKFRLMRSLVFLIVLYEVETWKLVCKERKGHAGCLRNVMLELDAAHPMEKLSRKNVKSLEKVIVTGTLEKTLNIIRLLKNFKFTQFVCNSIAINFRTEIHAYIQFFICPQTSSITCTLNTPRIHSPKFASLVRKNGWVPLSSGDT